MKVGKLNLDHSTHITASNNNHDDSNDDDFNRNRNKGSIYVLHLEDNNFYIGKTIRNVNTRIKEHLDNGYQTSGWTRLYKPLRRLAPLTSIPDDLESWERAETLERMWIYGIQRVRGWKYTQLNITVSDQLQVIMQLCERKDLCRCCGNFGHGISHCNSKKYSKAKWMKDIKKSGYLHPDYRGKVFERQFVNMLSRPHVVHVGETDVEAGNKQGNLSSIDRFNVSAIVSSRKESFHQYSNRLLSDTTVDNFSSDTISISKWTANRSSIEDYRDCSRIPISSSAAAMRVFRLSTYVKLSHKTMAILLEMVYVITTAW